MTEKQTAVEKPLSCGGKGPCCHVAYPHRHCEHCDVVVDLREHGTYPQIWPYYPQPSYPNWGPWTITNGTSDPMPLLPTFVANGNEPALGLGLGHTCEVVK